MIEIFNDIEQGTNAWFEVRRGLPTASMFSVIMAKGKDGGASIQRDDYLRKLAGEIITGEPAPEGYQSADMLRGHEMEDEARRYYALVQRAEPVRVGFVRNGRKGASPDSLLGTDGGLEIKSAAAHIQIKRLREGHRVPPEHVAQVQGSMWVTEREFWDFVSYCPRMPPVIVRATRDETYMASLARSVDVFNDELEAMTAWLRGLM